MKLLRFKYLEKRNARTSIGSLLSDGKVFNISSCYNDKKKSNIDIERLLSSDILTSEINELTKNPSKKYIEELNKLKILSPIKKPSSLRDAYSFDQHVESSRKNRGLDMIEEFYNFPVYYYSNPNSIVGSGTIEIDKFLSQKLDYELEIAAIIGKKGINISSQTADNYIYGFTIMNDFSSRKIQLDEMKLNLGPAKGKDFATALGPYIVTKDEFKNNIIHTKNGNHYDIELECFVNNNLLSQDNLKNMYWTFAQIIEQISKGTYIYPGDVIGSGTCGTGCFYELNAGKKNQQWLQDGDKVEITASYLGSLNNKIKII